MRIDQAAFDVIMIRLPLDAYAGNLFGIGSVCGDCQYDKHEYEENNGN